MDTAPALSTTEVIERVRAARLAEQRAAVEQLELALEWARLHPCPVQETPAHWGQVDLHGEALVPLAGAGAPWVAEFAPADLAAALGDQPRRRPPAARRRPRAGLPAAAAVGPGAGRRGPGLAGPADRPGDRRPQRRGGAVRGPADRRHPDAGSVRSRPPGWCRRPGSTSTPTAPSPTRRKPSPSAASGCATPAPRHHRRHDDPGHPRRPALRPDHHPDRRRPQRARRHRDPRGPPSPRGRDPRRPPTRPGPALRPRGCRAQPRCPRGAANLYVHLTPADLEAPVGAASIEKLGAATTRLLTDWLTRFAQAGAKITLRPVLDLNSDWAVDQHDPPEAMRETVLLRDAHCVFPGCRRDSRSCDLDHITEYLPHGRRRTTGPDPARQPRTPVPNPPPRQDPLRLGLQAPRRRAATPGPAPPATSTTSPRPRD